MSFKSKRTLVGIFLLGGALLFAVGLFLIGSRKQVFAHHFDLYTEFNKVDTLTPGAKVRVSGMDAGEVTGIDIPKTPSSRFRFTLQVDQKFHPVIREDSVATIETAGMVGNKYVDIKKGSAQSPECPTGGTLPSEEPFEMGDLMRQGSGIAKTLQASIEDLRKRADSAIDNITSAAGHVDGILVSDRGDIKKITSNGARMTGNADEIIAGIRQGHGTAGKLLTDDAVASDVTTTIAQAKQTSANIEQASQKVNTMTSDVQQNDLPDIHETLQNAQDMTDQLNQAVGTFLSSGGKDENTALALRDTVQGAQQTMTNLADDTEAVKHNFLLRGFFKRRGFYNLDQITPSKYASSEFVKKPRARVWLAAAGLFESRPDDSQKLTSYGPAILDQAMSDLAPYLPHNPIMVEGYSTGGMPDQRFLVARQRADEVRQYLESRFRLNSKLVGIMPLEDRPPPGSGKQMWDGVCLVLVASK
jgi:phospholipid/cholesterol/gamma-HCH transport system substrate-binding protein